MPTFSDLIHYQKKFFPEARTNMPRHDRTQMRIKLGIASLIHNHAAHGKDLLEVGGNIGWQTIAYRDQLIQDGSTATLYDWKDYRSEPVKPEVWFQQVDLETQPFPAADASFDVVVCNQVFEHLKNIFLPISQIHRVLRPGGFLIFSVPNLSALHNCVLLNLGHQPTTLAISSSHVRGFSIWSTTPFLTMSGGFKKIRLDGYGLHPFYSGRVSGLLKTFCHTPVWLLQKTHPHGPLWLEARQQTPTTTNF
ncbi:MAG: Methyltransferase type 11 [Magnetococcales bacterium]|nr:Methyltransferase type 11 [Magnetococcales bacterium]HIJ83193.1 class I SAM-dependent methyltransferase [Magnetococcales bacterium]